MQCEHLPVVIWLCKNGEQPEIKALRSAMAHFHFPMVKYLVRNGALRQGHTTADIRDFCKSWANGFDSTCFNLAVSAFLFDTFVKEHLSDKDVEAIVEIAIGRCSVAQLSWLQQQGIHLDMASIREHAIWHHGLQRITYRQKLDTFLQWLDTQASTMPRPQVKAIHSISN